MIKGNIWFNCLAKNKNLREFSRGDCFLEEIDGLDGSRPERVQRLCLRLTYFPFGKDQEVTADFDFDPVEFKALINRAYLINRLDFLPPI
jgi:hypothetical protein